MKENFGPCLGLVRISEGGNDDDPNDPGGRTSRGITQKEYDAYCQLHDFKQSDVWHAPELSINTIYHDYYWMPFCDGFVIGIDYCFFDMAVNHGPYRATVTMQRALKVDDDGHIGVITRTALQQANTVALIKMITVRRKTFYRQLHTYRHFGAGWIKRANFVQENALKMVLEPPDDSSPTS